MCVKERQEESFMCVKERIENKNIECRSETERERESDGLYLLSNQVLGNLENNGMFQIDSLRFHGNCEGTQ